MNILFEELYEPQEQKCLKYINENCKSFYRVFMTDTLFNVAYSCWRSKDSMYKDLIDYGCFTYGSFMDNIPILVDDYAKYGKILDIDLIWDFVFKGGDTLLMVDNIFQKLYEGCVAKGVIKKDAEEKQNLKNKFKASLKIYVIESEDTFGYYPFMNIASYFRDEKYPLLSSKFEVFFSYWFYISFQRNSYFSTINNTISLYNVVKDNKQLNSIFTKLENLEFEKTTNYNSNNIRHTFVRKVKNEKDEFIAFYTICFIENPYTHDIRIEPYAFMPNISVEDSKIPTRFTNLENQTALQRFETLNLLVNYNLLLLLNNECNLNMTKDNMDIHKISLCFGQYYPKPTFVDLLTEYDMPLYSFEEMDNILRDEALNVLGNGTKKLQDVLIEDSLYYLETEAIESHFCNLADTERAKNNLFSKINICDNNFPSVIAEMYRYMSDGFINVMKTRKGNKYVPTQAAIMLCLAQYIKEATILNDMEKSTFFWHWGPRYLNKMIDEFYDDTNLANELKKLEEQLFKAKCGFYTFANTNYYMLQDYFNDGKQYNNYEDYKNAYNNKSFIIAADMLNQHEKYEKMFKKKIGS